MKKDKVDSEPSDSYGSNETCNSKHLSSQRSSNESNSNIRKGDFDRKSDNKVKRSIFLWVLCYLLRYFPPYFIMFLLNLCLYFGYYHLALPFLYNGYNVEFLICNFVLWPVYFFNLASFILLMSVDEGSIENEIHYYDLSNIEGKCERCSYPKPKRTHHCSKCNKCFAKMDHHCLWLGKCIALRNYKLYIQYIYSGILLTFIWLFYAVYNLIYRVYGISIFICSCHILLSVFLSLIVISLAYEQSNQMLDGVTTIEVLSKSKFKTQKTRLENFKEVFGDDFTEWFIPSPVNTNITPHYWENLDCHGKKIEDSKIPAICSAGLSPMS